MIEPLSAFTGTTRPAAPEEKDEGKDEEPISKPEKSVDEQEDKKEEYDEDEDGDEKASVDVIKPVPGPEEAASKTEPSGTPEENYKCFLIFVCQGNINFMLCDSSVSLYALCKDQRGSH